MNLDKLWETPTQPSDDQTFHIGRQPPRPAVGQQVKCRKSFGWWKVKSIEVVNPHFNIYVVTKSPLLQMRVQQWDIMAIRGA